MKAMNKTNSVCKYHLALMMSLYLSVGHCAVTGPITPIQANAIITGGSCNVMLKSSDNPSSTPAASSVDVSINAVDKAGLVHGGVSFGDNSVTVSTSCTGVNDMTGAPTISVDGTPMPGIGNGYIFTRTDNDQGDAMDARVGVVMSKAAPASYFTVQAFNDTDYIKPNGKALVGEVGDFGGAAAFTQTYYFGLSCGRSELECQYATASTLAPGKIRLVIKLTFDYK